MAENKSRRKGELFIYCNREINCSHLKFCLSLNPIGLICEMVELAIFFSHLAKVIEIVKWNVAS